MIPKHTPVRLPFAGGRAGDMAIDFFAGGGIKLERTLVPIAANCSKKPEVTNAAAGTFLQEGRKAVVRCGLDRGPLCGTIGTFAAILPMSALVNGKASISLVLTKLFGALVAALAPLWDISQLDGCGFAVCSDILR